MPGTGRTIGKYTAAAPGTGMTMRDRQERSFTPVKGQHFSTTGTML